MLEAYVAAGFEPASFWELSPRLYVIHMNGAISRMKREHQERAWLAYHTALLEHMKKIPTLAELAGVEKTETAAKPWQAQLAAWEQYAAYQKTGRPI